MNANIYKQNGKYRVEFFGFYDLRDEKGRLLCFGIDCAFIGEWSLADGITDVRCYAYDGKLLMSVPCRKVETHDMTEE